MTINKSFLQFVATFKSIDDKKMIVSGVVGSDDSIDRHGDRINPAGWDLVNYKKAPTILLNHDYHALAIGKAINVEVKENQLLFDIQFSKTYDVAVQAYNLVKEGIMKAFSVGFIVKEWGKAGGQYTIDAAELLELSLVTVPANPNALSQEQLGMVDAFTKSLEAAEAKDKAEGDAEDELKTKVEAIEKTVTELKAESDKLGETIKAMVQKSIDEIINVTHVEADDEITEDPTLLALNALRAELKNSNKDSGKALQSLNKLLNIFDKKE